jgi:hypothetical protein
MNQIFMATALTNLLPTTQKEIEGETPLKKKFRTFVCGIFACLILLLETPGISSRSIALNDGDTIDVNNTTSTPQQISTRS